MDVKDFEWQAIELLVKDVLPAAVVRSLRVEAEFVNYEYSGCGYFLTLKHPAFPVEQVVCHEPSVVGTWGGIDSGFVVFLENGELMLECHSYPPNEVPPGYRDHAVTVTMA